MDNPQVFDELTARIDALAKQREQIRIMEICGTHTVSLFRTGVKSRLPENVRLISGPGCPVCVTSQGYIDAAIAAAAGRDVTICTYGDMLRVPGQQGSLEQQRAQGARVVVVYSIRDALRHAAEHPDEEVLFLAVGFETTAPNTALGLIEARKRDLPNFTVLPGHKLVMPAVSALMADGDVPIDGFMLPGHVSVVTGAEEFRPIVTDHGRPSVVVGFEPEQLLRGLVRLMELIVQEKAELDNVYAAAVSGSGNPAARKALEEVFEPAAAVWRAIGEIPGSGLALRDDYRRFDAEARFGLDTSADYDPPGCMCGQVIQGKVIPPECALFGDTCTPLHPVGPCMVSSEGTCSAWYRYGSKDER